MVKTLLLLPLAVLGLLFLYITFFKSPRQLPDVDLNAWWGLGQPKEDTTIKPYTVKFKDELVKDLKGRLKNHRPFTPPLEGVAFEYGMNTNTLNTWVQYWEKEYDFAARQKFFNQYSHYKTNIQGLDIHFLRVTPEVPSGVQLVPMLMLHGWPGSVREFYEAIPLLTAVSKERDFALELIIPSLPGYGFSEGAVRPGMGPTEVAVIMRNLMHRLGFPKFYVQGGDWGAIIAANLATFFPEEVLGHHTNMPTMMSATNTLASLIGTICPDLVVDRDLADRLYPLSDHYSHLLEETGYMHIQASKPDTVGLALLDSPSGLLAYIVEKFSTWTRKEHRGVEDGGLEFRFTKDQILDNLMLYWSTRSIITSMRLYAEGFNKKYLSQGIDEIPTPVPTWTLQSRHELAYVPPFLLKTKYRNLLHSSTLDDGGHFLALELPREFSDDVLKAVSRFRLWHTDNAKTEL